VYVACLRAPDTSSENEGPACLDCARRRSEERVDIATGRRSPVRELKPPDRTALMRVQINTVISDGAGYAYTYWKRSSRLLVVRGVPQ
jgi:hypothetical protein